MQVQLNFIGAFWCKHHASARYCAIH